MAIWKVIAAPIQLLPHPNAEALLIGKVDKFQVVVGKSNNYVDGQLVVFAPERAVLPEDLKGQYVNTQTGISYLSGPNSDRVKGVRLRGELSEGVTIGLDWVKAKLGTDVIPEGVDLAPLLGITKYEPPIPQNMAGAVEPIDVAHFKKHDVEQFRLYQDEFVPGEQVYATTKIHGSQLSLTKTAEGKFVIASKGFADKGLALVDSPTNFYWTAARNSGVFEALEKDFAGQEIQVWGEAIPCQGIFTYGQTKPTVKWFRVSVVDDVSAAPGSTEVPLHHILNMPLFAYFKENWVTVVYNGPFDPEALIALATGKEKLSGKELHVDEGIVVQPAIPRRSREGFLLLTKIINPKYKSTDEDLS